MPDIASVLKSEIARLARKEARSEIDGLKKVVAAHRHSIAELKRRNAELERGLKLLAKQTLAVTQATASRAGKALNPGAASTTPEVAIRFSADWLVAQRNRLGLSPAECGLLVGASDQSINKWEKGGVVPRKMFMPALAGLAKLGKRAARARLAELQAK